MRAPTYKRNKVPCPIDDGRKRQQGNKAATQPPEAHKKEDERCSNPCNKERQSDWQPLGSTGNSINYPSDDLRRYNVIGTQ